MGVNHSREVARFWYDYTTKGQYYKLAGYGSRCTI